jgi:hypothetical protein
MELWIILLYSIFCIIIIYLFFLRIEYANREGENMIMECMYFLQWKMVEECKNVWLCLLLHLKYLRRGGK